MTFDGLNLLFSVVLAIHNLDEYARYDDFARTFHSRLSNKLANRRSFRNAAILLTLTVAVLDALTHIYRTDLLLDLSKIAICALMINAIGHCVLSVRRRAVLPGTLSAAIVVLPYCAIAIAVMRANLGDSSWAVARFAVLGALTAPLAVLCFLWISYALDRTRLGSKRKRPLQLMSGELERLRD